MTAPLRRLAPRILCALLCALAAPHAFAQATPDAATDAAVTTETHHAGCHDTTEPTAPAAEPPAKAIKTCCCDGGPMLSSRPCGCGHSVAAMPVTEHAAFPAAVELGSPACTALEDAPVPKRSSEAPRPRVPPPLGASFVSFSA